MSSICNFLPPKMSGSINTIHFVYETENACLRQPFLHPVYRIILAVRGTAELTLAETRRAVCRGTLFFAFPGCPYTLSGSEDFAYIYISFMGSGAPALMEQFAITPQNPLFGGMEHLCEPFAAAIRSIDQRNGSVLAESMLLYALSFIPGEQSAAPLRPAAQNLFEAMVEYVDSHYGEADISLGRLADIFSYSEKYLSALFKRNMHIGFNAYLRNLRIQRAQELIEQCSGSLAEIARTCGYSDALYFSKVFKQRTGWTPTEYARIAAERHPAGKYLR